MQQLKVLSRSTVSATQSKTVSKCLQSSLKFPTLLSELLAPESPLCPQAINHRLLCCELGKQTCLVFSKHFQLHAETPILLQLFFQRTQTTLSKGNRWCLGNWQTPSLKDGEAEWFDYYCITVVSLLQTVFFETTCKGICYKFLQSQVKGNPVYLKCSEK